MNSSPASRRIHCNPTGSTAANQKRTHPWIKPVGCTEEGRGRSTAGPMERLLFNLVLSETTSKVFKRIGRQRIDKDDAGKDRWASVADQLGGCCPVFTTKVSHVRARQHKRQFRGPLHRPVGRDVALSNCAESEDSAGVAGLPNRDCRSFLPRGGNDFTGTGLYRL